MLRLITQGRVSPEEAVRAYHSILQAKGLKPKLPLDQDLQLTDQSMSYDGAAARRATVVVPRAEASTIAKRRPDNDGVKTAAASNPSSAWPKLPDGSPDFASMDSRQRGDYDQRRLTRKFG
jgi:hypothetical protein